MSILVNQDTRLLVQGITGKTGTFHTRQCIDYGTNVVAGVTPGKGGQTWEDNVPVCNSVAEAVQEHGANVSVIYVPPPFAADSILEAIEAEIPLVICITEGVPVADMAEVRQRLNQSNKTRLIGPNCPASSPASAKWYHARIHPQTRPRRRRLPLRNPHLRSRLATHQSRPRPVHLHRYRRRPHQRHLQTDAVRMFNEDPDTDAIIMIGEIGGSAEEEACAYIKEHVQKPVAGFIAGATAPKGRTMGHAGAIVSASGAGTAEAKFAAMEDAGVSIARNPSEIADALLKFYKG